jgi:hypothetical protein
VGPAANPQLFAEAFLKKYGKDITAVGPRGRTETIIPLIRKTFGDDMALYADANGFYSVEEAIRVGRLLEEYRYGFFEEPVMFDWYEETRQVADALILPVAGGVILTWAFVQSLIDLSDPANSYSGAEWFGLSVHLAVTLAFLALGLVLMVLWWIRSPAFFRERPEAAAPRPDSPPARHRPGRSYHHGSQGAEAQLQRRAQGLPARSAASCFSAPPAWARPSWRVPWPTARNCAKWTVSGGSTPSS